MTTVHSEAVQDSVETVAPSCLSLNPVETLQEVETMRQIRNACRFFMTRHTQEIQPHQQIAWWEKLDRTKVRPYLLRRGYEPIGYGLIRLDDKGREWLTGALLEEYRGNGYGKYLFCGLIHRCEGECWLEVWEYNVPARRLYESIGFKVQWATIAGNGDRTLLTMKHE